MFGDQIRLKQVMINLIKCALTHTECGFININAAYECEKEELRVQLIDYKNKKHDKYKHLQVGGQLYNLFNKIVSH